MVILKFTSGTGAYTDNDGIAASKFADDLFHTTDDRWLIPPLKRR